MSTSTSQRSDRIRSIAHVTGVIILCGALSWPALASGPASKSSTNAHALLERIRSDVSRDGSFPNDRHATLKWLRGPFRSEGHGSDRWFGVVQIRFQGLTNSYCRLVAADQQGGEASALMEVPESANPDQCRGVRSIRRADLNGDGVPDLFLSVVVPSNRDPVDVIEPMVFLSQSDPAHPYCYSGKASRAVGASVSSPDAALPLVRQAIAADPSGLLECGGQGR